VLAWFVYTMYTAV